MKKYFVRKSLSVLVLFFVCTKGIAQFGGLTGLIRPGIQQKIEVIYVPDPTAAQPFIDIKTVNILKLGTNWLLGTGLIKAPAANPSNAMNKSTMLIDALFKTENFDATTSISKSEKPDTKFQETVYEALELSGKKIKLYLFNDYNGVDEKYLKQFKLYYKTIGTKGYIWPGTFSEPVATSGEYAGSIIVGENYLKSKLLYNKQWLISMIAQIGLQDFGPAKDPIVYTLSLEGEVIPFTNTAAAVSDSRRIENQGIANAFMLYYSDALKSEIFNWAHDFYATILPVTEQEFGIVAAGEDDTRAPAQRFSLHDKIIKMNSSYKGKPLNDYPLLKDAAFKNFVMYNSLDFEDAKDIPMASYLFINDGFLGLYFYQFVRAFGLHDYVEAIKWDKQKLLQTKPGQKTATLIQNMCLFGMGDKNVSYIKENPGSVESKKAILPLAMFNYLSFTGFDKADPNFKETIRKVSGAVNMDSKPAFEELIGFYLSYWRPKLATAIKTDTENDDGYILSKTSKIARSMGIK